jgi:hypothetical protein
MYLAKQKQLAGCRLYWVCIGDNDSCKLPRYGGAEWLGVGAAVVCCPLTTSVAGHKAPNPVIQGPHDYYSDLFQSSSVALFHVPLVVQRSSLSPEQINDV